MKNKSLKREIGNSFPFFVLENGAVACRLFCSNQTKPFSKNINIKEVVQSIKNKRLRSFRLEKPTIL
ncbi:hypothetical protein [Bizionia paragorgiae]|uniref:hypothetical protein n=1 Tax=Bizionia paragorgiae TaxID=283786 RepID=UPI0015A65176|nr:hypothetical protein [Bizionia paragorgiae]